MNPTLTTLQTESRDGVLTITLNRPESYNAFNERMSVELAAAFRAAQRDDAVRCVVLTGAGKAFCSGQDLAEIKARYSEEAAGTRVDFGAHLRQKFNPIVARMRSLEKPIIAGVNGAAAGAGASFAFACDLRVCARSAYFMLAFVHVGLVPDSGATQTLAQHVGYCRAAELCMLGEKLPADEALRAGLVNRVVEDAQLGESVATLAARLASLPTRAIGLTKRALNHAWTAEFEAQLDYEAYLQQIAGQTADHREGVLAFLEKRKPKFRGS